MLGVAIGGSKDLLGVDDVDKEDELFIHLPDDDRQSQNKDDVRVTYFL